jgi:hypothetical protein
MTRSVLMIIYVYVVCVFANVVAIIVCVPYYFGDRWENGSSRRSAARITRNYQGCTNSLRVNFIPWRLIFSV